MTKKTIIVAAVLLLAAALFVGAGAAEPSATDVAKIDDTGYATLKEAVAAVIDNTPTTITLLKDVTDGTGIIVATDKNIIFDFDGHTYTVTNDLAGSSTTKTQCFQLLNGATVEMKDGTIVANSGDIKMLIQNYCDLTLNSMTLDAKVGTNNVKYVLSNNCGNVKIAGSTSITAKAGQVAFDVYFWPSGNYPVPPSVTVDTTGTITGNIEVARDTSASSLPTETKLLQIDNAIVNGDLTVDTAAITEDTTVILINGGSFTTSGDSATLIDKYVPDEKKEVVKVEISSDSASSDVKYTGALEYTIIIPATFDFGGNLNLQSEVGVNFKTVGGMVKMTVTPYNGDAHELKYNGFTAPYVMMIGDTVWPSEVTFSPKTENTEEVVGKVLKPVTFTIPTKPTVAGTYTDQLTFATEVVPAN